MMMSTENPVHHHLPVLEHTLSPAEIHEPFSLHQSEPSLRATNRSVYSVEERKHRRMMSNRESARRSRLRKKTYLENLKNEASRLKLENRRLKNRLCMVNCGCHSVRGESNRLLSESIYLGRKLAALHQILAPTMQLQ